MLVFFIVLSALVIFIGGALGFWLGTDPIEALAGFLVGLEIVVTCWVGYAIIHFLLKFW